MTSTLPVGGHVVPLARTDLGLNLSVCGHDVELRMTCASARKRHVSTIWRPGWFFVVSLVLGQAPHGSVTDGDRENVEDSPFIAGGKRDLVAFGTPGWRRVVVALKGQSSGFTPFGLHDFFFCLGVEVDLECFLIGIG